jgi:uncharacterized protein YlxP (DUF503 family)
VSATLGVARVTLQFESTFSLKDKRSEVKSVTQKLRNQFNAAISEIEDLDDMRVATLGIAVLSTSGPHANQMLSTIVSRLENLLDTSTLADVTTELITM